MKNHPVLLIAALALAGCAGTRPDVRLTSEPSIERALDIIASVPEGRTLMKFLHKNPVRFEYSNTAGLCHKFALKRGQIFMPADYKGSDLVLALAIARAAQIYRLSAQSGLEEIISEEEELGALFQARIALDINLVTADFKKAGGAPEIKTDFCTYVLESSRYAMAQARKEALTPDADCQRPLETLENQRVWLEKTRKAINDETFYQLLYERDLARVKKGSMPASEAMKRDAAVRALPTYEVYRFQRTFYDDQNEVFKRFARLYAAEVARDAAWRASHQAEIDRARTEFSDCNMR
ncbi:MAG: hypothetical protein CVU79_12295 [Elusimicrobia bacterium HGW-Elusimicrobia-3]|jgi:hypothetical protein|nr:MAG: hypothetical protein CVU79_12295 [Elusimicrobia bacterium HGW-Elusimicrobia-3]